MKTLKITSILLLLLVSTVSCAQNKKMKTEVDKIKELGKDSIIQLALDITHAKIDVTSFEKILVSANHEDVYVSFINSVKYIPLNKEFTTDVTVSILGKTTSYNAIANPSNFHSKDERKYYNPNRKENKKVIQFVFDAINKSKEIGNTNSEDLEELNMTIKEKDTYYAVLVINESQESNYKVKKETGEIYDATHAHLSKMPLPLEEGEEEMHDLTYYFIDQINAKACVTNEVLKSTFESISENIQNNSNPVHNGELGTTISGYISNNINFSHQKYSDKFPEIISIYDGNEAITYYLFKNEEESFNMYYERHFSPQLFNEQKYKNSVTHFCKNIVNKDFKKSDMPSKITYQTLSQMNRETLINLAKNKVDKHLKLLKEKPFNYKGIDTKVLKNSTAFIVYFEQSFKYVPLHSAHYYGFYVNLLEDDINKLNRANEFESIIQDNGGFPFYVPSPQDLEKIDFVKKAISYKEGQIVVVNEKEKHYELGYETSGEKVDKKTGKVFGFWDRIYAPEEDPLVEMLANPCPTQKEFKNGFEHLKEIILKKGRKKRVKGDNYPNYIYKNFKYRNISEKNFPMEVIYVVDNAENVFYQIIKSDDSYQIDIKDYQQIIALQKRKAARAHFCNHILSLIKK